MTSNSTSTPPPSARAASALVLSRGLCHVIAIATITVWGFVDWPLPFPGILTGIGFLVLSVLVWALFLSPRPVLRTDRFGQAIVELLLLAAAVAALLSFGVFWVWPAAFGLVAAVVGFLASTPRR